MEVSSNFNMFVLKLINTDMKLKNETTTEIVDKETGEVISSTISKTFSVKAKSDEFYFTFLTLLKDIIGLKSIVDLKVLYVLCNMAEFNTGKVSMSTNKRGEICEMLGITYNTLANSISRLKKNNFITDKKRDYTINPDYFWKGDLKTRDQLLKEGGKLTLNIEFENEVTNE